MLWIKVDNTKQSLPSTEIELSEGTSFGIAKHNQDTSNRHFRSSHHAKRAHGYRVVLGIIERSKRLELLEHQTAETVASRLSGGSFAGEDASKANALMGPQREAVLIFVAHENGIAPIDISHLEGFHRGQGDPRPFHCVFLSPLDIRIDLLEIIVVRQCVRSWW